MPFTTFFFMTLFVISLSALAGEPFLCLLVFLTLLIALALLAALESNQPDDYLRDAVLGRRRLLNNS
jgi:uncharacterized membrane protein